MSRHRAVRSMNYSEEYEGFDDVYGHSVEDDYCISPSEARFLFDRSRNTQISAFIDKENDIAEENEDTGTEGSGQEASFQKPKLSDVEEDKLKFCVDEIQNVIGDTVPLAAIEEVVIKHGFDVKESLNALLDQQDSAQQLATGETKQQREKRAGTKDKGVKALTNAENFKKENEAVGKETTADSSVKVVSSGILKKGFDIGESLKPPSNASSPRCRSPAGGRMTPTEGESASKTTGRLNAVREKINAEEQYKSERGDRKEVMHLVVIGHVDAGKSTLMGHLLYALGQVNQKTMHKYEQESKKVGKQSFVYAWILDETGEERTRGITMDVGQSKFETDTKIVNLLDAPGHKDFIPNMITGAAQADVALLVVDATRGEFETGFESGGQTREHALLVRSLGVSQLAVVVNKLDTVGWSEERFREIEKKLGAFLKQAGFRESDVTYVPCSGLAGENLVEKSTEPALTSWYNGPTLLKVIDNFKVPERPVSKPLRISVNDIYKGTGSGFCITGRVETGFVRSGDKILVLPQNETALVKGINIDELPVTSAYAGDRVNITLSNYDMQNVNVGYILCDPASPVPVTTKFEARIVIFNISVPITKGYPVVIHSQSLAEQGSVVSLVAQLNKSSGEVIKKRPRCLTKHSNAIVELETSRPICLELYRDVKELGRIMLRVGGVSIAAGLVTKIF